MSSLPAVGKHLSPLFCQVMKKAPLGNWWLFQQYDRAFKAKKQYFNSYIYYRIGSAMSLDWAGQPDTP